MKEFGIKPRLCFGPDALCALEVLGAERVLVVTDGFLAASGLVGRVKAHLQGPVEVFDQVTPDPTLELAAKGAAALRDFRPGALVGFGGGSSLDCAKAVLHFGLPPGERIPFYAVPTTAGTGSEVTSFAVLTDEARGVKVPLVDDSLLPDAALLDPTLLAGVPARAAADTGMDVITHAVEAFVSSRADPFSDALAREAAARAWRALPGAVERMGETAERAEMLWASTMAGAAFNSASLGVCHSLAHALGGAFHLPHGRLNGILLPEVIRFNAGLEGYDSPALPAAERYAALAKACGLGASNPRTGTRSLINALMRCRERLDMPASLTAAGVEKRAVLDRLDTLAEQALEDVCTASNPRPAGLADLKKLLLSCI